MLFWMPTVERLEMTIRIDPQVGFLGKWIAQNWRHWLYSWRSFPTVIALWYSDYYYFFFFLIWDVNKPSLLLCWQSHGVSKKVVDIVLLPPVLHCIHAERLGIQDSVKNFCDKAVWEMHFNGLNLIDLLLIKHKDVFCLQTFCISQQST